MEKDSERRNIGMRADVVARALESAVDPHEATLTVEMLVIRLGVSSDAAARILERLTTAGVVAEILPGVWARSIEPATLFR